MFLLKKDILKDFSLMHKNAGQTGIRRFYGHSFMGEYCWKWKVSGTFGSVRILKVKERTNL